MAYRDVILADHPSNYWRLGEPWGTTAVDAIGAANGTISGGVTLNQAGAIIDPDPAMTFDMTGRIATTALVVTPPAVTLEAWIKTSERTASQAVVGNRANPQVANQVLLSTALSGGVVRLQFSSATSGVVMMSTRDIADGQWHHVAAVADGVSARLYIDGSLDSTFTVSRPSGATGAVNIAYEPLGGLAWRGSLDEIAIYPVALTGAQILAHYQAGMWVPAPVSRSNVTTVADIITAAFRRLNIIESNAVPAPEDMADGFLRFKSMLALWRLQRLTIPFVQRVTTPIVAMKQTYTVGTGGDLACPRPSQPAALTWTLRNPSMETPLTSLTDQQAMALPLKDQIGTFPIYVWYQPLSGVPPVTTLGMATLYPIPTAPSLSLCLYAPIGIDSPAATSSTLIVPESYDLALMDNLAKVLWPEWRENVPLDPELRASAIESLGWLKTNNVRQSDLGIDPQWIFQGQGNYDITTDQGS